jgi:putative MATE family efflux protein
LFSNRDLARLLVPLVIEQVLTALMGTIDTIMVSTISSAAVSGVSLVDSINTLMLYLFAALATGGTIVCSQYLGRNDLDGANNAARQVLLSVLVLSAAITVVCVGLRRPILSLIFGSVEPAVMDAALVYFLLTALSYPFIGLYNASAALYRSTGNSKLPMVISASCNLLNILGNSLTIFVLGMGVTGAALSTLLSRVLAAVVLLSIQRRPHQVLTVGPYRSIRPDFPVIALVLSIGVPTGLENGLFQFGKLAVQSAVSTLSTPEIAAQAIVVVLEALTSMPSMAIGLGLITVAGRCMGAGRPDEARRYIVKLTVLSAAVLLVTNWLVYFLTGPIVRLARMEAEAAALTCSLMLVISVVKPFLWPLAFTPVNGMKAAGDVRFAMLTSTLTMWVFRVGLCYLLILRFGFGPLGVWVAMFADWGARSVIYTLRFASGRWARKQVLKD